MSVSLTHGEAAGALAGPAPPGVAPLPLLAEIAAAVRGGAYGAYAGAPPHSPLPTASFVSLHAGRAGLVFVGAAAAPGAPPSSSGRQRSDSSSGRARSDSTSGGGGGGGDTSRSVADERTSAAAAAAASTKPLGVEFRDMTVCAVGSSLPVAAAAVPDDDATTVHGGGGSRAGLGGGGGAEYDLHSRSSASFDVGGALCTLPLHCTDTTRVLALAAEWGRLGDARAAAAAYDARVGRGSGAARGGGGGGGARGNLDSQGGVSVVDEADGGDSGAMGSNDGTPFQTRPPVPPRGGAHRRIGSMENMTLGRGGGGGLGSMRQPTTPSGGGARPLVSQRARLLSRVRTRATDVM